MTLRRLCMTLPAYPPTRKSAQAVEHHVGETQTAILDAIDELKPVAKRLAQYGLQADHAAVLDAIHHLALSTKRLAELTKYAR